MQKIWGVLCISALALAACRNEPIEILEAKRLGGPPTRVSPDFAKRDPVALSITIAPEGLKQISETDFFLHQCTAEPKRLGVTELYLGDLQIRGSGMPSTAAKQELLKQAAEGSVTLTAVAPGSWIDDEDYLCGHFVHDQKTDLFSDPNVSAVVRFPSIWRKPNTVQPDLLRTIALGCGVPQEDYSWRVEADRISLNVEAANQPTADSRGQCLVERLRKSQVRADYGTIVFHAEAE